MRRKNHMKFVDDDDYDDDHVTARTGKRVLYTYLYTRR